MASEACSSTQQYGIGPSSHLKFLEFPYILAFSMALVPILLAYNLLPQGAGLE